MAALRAHLPAALGFAAALAAGWVVYPAVVYEKTPQPLQFSHARHTGEAVGMACADCHPFEAGGRFAGIPPVESCAGCHAAAIGTTEDEKRLVADYVEPGREIPWLVYARQPDLAYFDHARHVQLAELPCERCHGPHGQSEGLRPFERERLSGYSKDIWGSRITGVARAEWDGMKMGDCSDCHRERGVVESCLDCHK
jgi:hypothetical protein